MVELVALNIQDKKKMLSLLMAAGLGAGAATGGSFLVAPNEGWRNKPYVDPVGIETVCAGHTGTDINKNKTYTDEECLGLLAKDLWTADQAVHTTIHVPLTVYQEAALVSFTYNVGEGNLAKSTLAKDFNSKNYDAGCAQLLKWVYTKRHKSPGLVTRRTQEYKMCMGQVELD
jgi:lysozyme